MGSAASREAIKAIRDWAVTEGRKTATNGRATETLRQPRLQRRGPEGPSAQGGLQGAAPHRHARRGARSLGGRRRRLRGQGLGARARRDALHALVPAAHRHHRREARLLPVADARGRRDRRVQRQGADPGRARRLELPVRRHALHVRGPRLHGVGPDQPAVDSDQPERRDAGHPDRVRELDRRGARQEDAAAALDGGAVGAGAAHPQAVRLARRARRHDLRPRAGVLPDRRELLLRAPRPDQRRPHALRRQAAQGPGARGSVLRLDPRARARLHDGRRSRALQAAACRSRRATTRWRRASTRSRRCSRTPTWRPTTR